MNYQKVTRKDFSIVGDWDRSRLTDINKPGYYYEIYYTKTGKRIGGRYTSKRKASSALNEFLRRFEVLRLALESGQVEIIEGKIVRKEVNS